MTEAISYLIDIIEIAIRHTPDRLFTVVNSQLHMRIATQPHRRSDYYVKMDTCQAAKIICKIGLAQAAIRY
ncbi:hypothetical protein ASZ90_006522 [hydrocarbon metagenome]|uniref:Uncharacterized protein n=1 Tax=hydrocarbon metagenome TaxID=938273 RepID=A0A0W8FTU9_9ZZZZ